MTQALLDLVLIDTPWLLDINNLATISVTPPKNKIEIKCEETYQPLSPPVPHTYFNNIHVRGRPDKG